MVNSDFLDLKHTPVCITNRLMYPNGAPASGEKVRFVMRVYDGWLDPAMHGRVLGTSMAWTNAEGVWSALLLPYTAFDEHLQPSIYVDVYELDQHVGIARIKDATKPGEVRWLRDCLVDPPTPAPERWRPISEIRDLHDVAYPVDDQGRPLPPNDGDVLVFSEGRWRPATAPVGATDLGALTDVDNDIDQAADGSFLVKRGESWTDEVPEFTSKLASLEDVDGETVGAAADDAVLIKRGGVWTAVPLNLPALTDIDADSMTDPQTGDVLTYLGPKGWGIKRSEAVWLTWVASPKTSDATGRTVTLTIASATPGSGFELWWGDESNDAQEGVLLPEDTDTVEHTYAADGAYTVWLYYQDPAIDDGSPAKADVPIPLTGDVEATNDPSQQQEEQRD